MFPQLYHAHHSRHLEDIPFWLGLAKKVGDPVLELGCGTGRVLIPLAEAGYRVFGMDHDLSMLKLLNINIDLKKKPKPLLLAADISGFHLAAQFPLIFLPCNTFSTLDDIHRKACLDCVHRHLQAGGIFAVSLPNPELLMDLPSFSDAQIEDEFFHPQTGNPVQVSSSWRRTKNAFNVTWSYDHLHPDGTVEHLVVETHHQITSLETYKQEMAGAGLDVTEIYGDYDRSTYKADAPYLIILASNSSY